MGPIEFLIIGFEGNHFTGEILPEIHRLKDAGTIRVLDLLFIQKDDTGHVTSVEMSDLSDAEQEKLGALRLGMGEWIAEDDIEQVGEALPDQSSVAMVVIEHSWAIPLQEATRRANGTLLAEKMVPRDVVEQVEANSQQKAA